MLMCHDKNLLSSWLPRSGYSQNAINSNLEYPIPIAMGLQNSNYIDVELLNNISDEMFRQMQAYAGSGI